MRTELLLDPRTGIVTDLSTVALGGGPHARQATVSETAHFGLPSGGPATSGCSWGEPAVAARAAVAEAVERYCGHLVAVDRLRRGSFREWRAGGLDAVDPAALALYRPGQLARPGFPFAGLGAADEVAWVEGHDLAGNPVLVPAALVWLAPGAHSAGRGGRQVVLPVNAGIAAGPTLGAACRAALAEVVERHSLAQAWHGGARFVPIDAGPAGGEAWAVPNRFAAAVVVSVLHDRDDELLGVGCATGSTWDQAAAKAGLESALMVDTARRVAAGMAAWERPDGPLAPHRPDRRYASSYQPDLLDVTDTTCHLQLLLDPAVRLAVERRLRWGGSRRAVTADLHRPIPVDALGEALVAGGLRPVTVDLTTDDVAACGLAVARVVVPGLRSTGPAAFPYLGDGLDPLPAEPCLVPVPHV